MFSTNNLILRSKELAIEIEKIQHFLIRQNEKQSLVARKYPNNRYKYFRKTYPSPGRPVETYINQDHINDAKKLAYIGYAKEYLKDLINEKEAIDNYLKWTSSTSHAADYLKAHPGHAALILDSLAKKISPEIQQRALAWKNQPYIRSNLNPEALNKSTIVPGLMVRSKSEADIISRLEAFGVAYHYEELFDERNYNGFPIHLDFKCFNARTCKEFWWEHQGKWDDLNYTSNVAAREKLLYQAGLVPWKNLIITTETLDLPLDILWVDEIIKFYLI